MKYCPSGTRVVVSATAGGRAHQARRLRQRPRHPGGAPAARLRAVLPRRRGSLARARWHRARSVNREAHGRGHARQSLGRERGWSRLDVQRLAPARERAPKQRTLRHEDFTREARRTSRRGETLGSVSLVHLAVALTAASLALYSTMMAALRARACGRVAGYRRQVHRPRASRDHLQAPRGTRRRPRGEPRVVRSHRLPVVRDPLRRGRPPTIPLSSWPGASSARHPRLDARVVVTDRDAAYQPEGRAARRPRDARRRARSTSSPIRTSA